MNDYSESNQKMKPNDPDVVGPGFGERHRKLIITIIIIFVLAGPLVFAALTVLSLSN